MNLYYIDNQRINKTPHIPHYRNLFNGQEVDNEVYGDGAVLGYEFRQYDARIGRWWSVDPMSDKYPGVSPYVFCNGSPIVRTDPTGSSDDWIYNLKTNEYVWDGNVHSAKDTPLGYEYVGASREDVHLHFKSKNPWTHFFPNPKFGRNRTPYYGEIQQPKILSSVEMWLTTSSRSKSEAIIKTSANIVYNYANAPYSFFFGKTIAGSSLSSIQKTDAFVDFAPNVILPAFKLSGQILKTGTGLTGYNKFVQAQKKMGTLPQLESLPAGMSWQSQTGNMFQINKSNQQLMDEGNNILRGVMVGKSLYQTKESEKATE